MISLLPTMLLHSQKAWVHVITHSVEDRERVKGLRVSDCGAHASLKFSL